MVNSISPNDSNLTCPIKILNDEVFLHIFGKLDIRDIITASNVCRKFAMIARDNMTWRNIANQISMDVFPDEESVKQQVLNRIRDLHFFVTRYLGRPGLIVTNPNLVDGYPKTLKNTFSILRELYQDKMPLFIARNYDITKCALDNQHLLSQPERFRLDFERVLVRDILTKLTDRPEEENRFTPKDFILRSRKMGMLFIDNNLPYILALVSLRGDVQYLLDFQQDVSAVDPNFNDKDEGRNLFAQAIRVVVNTGEIDILNRVITLGVGPRGDSLDVALSAVEETKNVEIWMLTLNARNNPELHVHIADAQNEFDFKRTHEQLKAKPTPFTFNKALRAAGATGEVSILEDVIDLGAVPSIDSLDEAIDIFRKTGNQSLLEVALTVCRPSLNTLDLVLETVGQTHDLNLLVLILKSGARPSPITLSIAIEVCAQIGQLRVLDLVLKAGAKPNEETFDEAIRAIAKTGNFQIVRRVQQAGAKPSDDSYEIADQVAKQMGHQEILSFVKEAGANEASYRFDEAFRSFAEKGDRNKLSQAISQRAIAGKNSFNKILKLIGQTGKIELLKTAKECGVVPSLDSFKMALQIFFETGKKEILLTGLEVGLVPTHHDLQDTVNHLFEDPRRTRLSQLIRDARKPGAITVSYPKNNHVYQFDAKGLLTTYLNTFASVLDAAKTGNTQFSVDFVDSENILSEALDVVSETGNIEVLHKIRKAKIHVTQRIPSRAFKELMDPLPQIEIEHEELTIFDKALLISYQRKDPTILQLAVDCGAIPGKVSFIRALKAARWGNMTELLKIAVDKGASHSDKKYVYEAIEAVTEHRNSDFLRYTLQGYRTISKNDGKNRRDAIWEIFS